MWLQKGTLSFLHLLDNLEAPTGREGWGTRKVEAGEGVLALLSFWNNISESIFLKQYFWNNISKTIFLKTIFLKLYFWNNISETIFLKLYFWNHISETIFLKKYFWNNNSKTIFLKQYFWIGTSSLDIDGQGVCFVYWLAGRGEGWEHSLLCLFSILTQYWFSMFPSHNTDAQFSILKILMLNSQLSKYLCSILNYHTILNQYYWCSILNSHNTDAQFSIITPHCPQS